MCKQFYDSLNDVQKDAFDSLFITICEHGSIKNPQKFRHKIGSIQCKNEGTVEEFPVSEFKIGSGPGFRIMAVLEGNVYVLTHGCPKPKDSQLPGEIQRA